MTIALQIDGVTVKTPKEFQVGLQTIDADSSGRNANGEMIRDIIAEKKKLEIKWGPLSDLEASSILRKINKPFFTCRYPDPQEGGMLTRTFYCGDRSLPSYSWNEKFQEIRWEGLSANFIEQ